MPPIASWKQNLKQRSRTRIRPRLSGFHSLKLRSRISYIALSSHHHLNWYITNSQNDQLPVGLIAQLIEHCTGIAEVMGSNPVKALELFKGNLSAADMTAAVSQLLKTKATWKRLKAQSSRCAQTRIWGRKRRE